METQAQKEQSFWTGYEACKDYGCVGPNTALVEQRNITSDKPQERYGDAIANQYAGRTRQFIPGYFTKPIENRTLEIA
jgi:hypothetical protein